MSSANKKVTQPIATAKQNAQILTQVESLLKKNLIVIDAKDVYLYPQIWKNQSSALNWMKCLQIYCILKRKFKTTDPLTFRDVETREIIGTLKNSTAKVLLNFEA